MPDIMEAIRQYVISDPALAGIHVGEVVPETTGEEYIWMSRSGENQTDELSNLADIDGITIDVEVVSEDINRCRLLTREVKFWLRRYTLHSQTFDDDFGLTRTLHGFSVEDHDDLYIPKSLQDDSELNVGALRVTVLYGGICQTVGPGPIVEEEE